MKYIPLKNAKSALVDNEDYEAITANYGMRWSLMREGVRTGSRKSTLFLHRVVAELMGADLSKVRVYHKSKNKRDNRRANLIIRENVKELPTPLSLEGEIARIKARVLELAL